MKNRIEDNLACIIFALPEKRFQVWVFMIVVQAVQLMEPGAYLLSQLNPDNNLFYCLRIILGFFTFRPLTQQFLYLSVVIQALYWTYIVLLAFRLVFGTPHVCGFLAYVQIWCPVVITVSMESFKHFDSTYIQVLSGFSAVSSITLWALRLFTINQDYLSSNAKLSSIKSTLRLVLFSIQSVLVYLPPTQTLLTVLVAVSLSMSLVVFLLSITIIENVNQELEYLHYLKCIFATIFYSTLQIVICSSQMNSMLVIILAMALVLERFQGLKFLFQIKYNFLLQRIIKVQSDNDLIIFLEMLGSNVSTGQNTRGVRMGRNKSYWTNKKIEFGFHVKARSTCLQLCIKRARQQGGDITIGQLLKQETYTLVQSFMHKRIKSKSKLVPIVLSYQFLKRELVIPALTIQASIQGDFDFNTRVLKKVLRMRIQHATSIKQKMGSPNKISQGFCCVGTSIATSEIRKVSKLQNLFKQIIQKLIHLSSNKTKLLTRLSNKTVSTTDVVGILLQQATLKDEVQKIVNNLDVNVNKEVLTLFYIYYKYFCSQKFSVFQTLTSHMFAIDNITVNSRSQHMICLVSAVEKNMGAILTANSRLVEFFKMDLDHIRQGLEHIEDMLPRPLSVIHNTLIAKSLQTGVSNIIGRKNQFYMVRGGVAYPVQFYVKFQVFGEGINFSCQFKILKDKNFILYDKENYILGLSETAKQILPKKKQQCRFIYEVFPSLRQTSFGASRKANFTNTVQRISQYQMKYRFRNKFYETSDFQLGICQFDNNQASRMEDSRQHITKSLVDESWDSTATQVREKQNQQHQKLEIRIISIFKNEKSIWSLIPVVCTYGVILLVITIAFYESLKGIISQSQITSRFTSMQYDNSLQCVFLARNRMINMQHAANIGMYPIDFQIKGMNMSTFLVYQARKQLRDLYQYKANVIGDIGVLPSELVDQIKAQKMMYLTRSGGLLPVDFVTFISTYISQQEQILSYTNQEFQSSWNSIAQRLSTVSNIILSNLDRLIQGPMQAQIAKVRTQSMLRFKIFLVVVECIVLLGIGVFSVVIHRTSEQQTKYIQLLLYLEDKFFKQEMHKNYQINIILNQIAKSSMSGLAINQNAQSVTFTCLGERRKFSRGDTGVVKEENNNDSPLPVGTSASTNPRKVLDNKSQRTKKYIYISITTLIFLPIACLLLIGSFSVTTPVFTAEQFYQTFAKLNANLSISTSSLLNLNIIKITKSTQTKLVNVPVADYFKICVYGVSNRMTDSMLTSFYPKVSNDKALVTQIESYLYSSKCSDPTDNTCHQVLGGSLTRGIPSALLAFTTAANSLYNSLNPEAPSSQDFSTLKQLVEMYDFYFRSLIQRTQFIFGLTNNIYQNSLLELGIILKVSVVVQLFLLVFMAWFVINSQTKIQRLKKEVITIMPVNILSSNINFNFEIRSLIEK